MSWTPDDRIGVVVLTNLSGTNPVPTIVMRSVYDRLLGLDRTDWVGRAKADEARARERQQAREKQREDERVQRTSPSHRLDEYAGSYEHPAYGTVRVRHDGGALRLTLDSLDLTLEHFHYDVFRGVRSGGAPNPLEGERVRFSYGAAGKVDSLAIALEPAVAEIVFKRTRDTKTTSSSRH